MRFIIGLAVLGILASACSKPATKIGTECAATSDCNVPGQACVKGICTKGCKGDFGDNGCPVGYSCSVGDEAVGFTCNKVAFSVDEKGNAVMLGKSCATDPGVCNDTGDPNPAPQCRKGHKPRLRPKDPYVPLDSDPNAYCTGSCETDADCPIRMQCAVDYDDVKKCLMRGRCSACELNDHCPKDWVCAAIDGGKAKYCTTTCNTAAECPGTAQGIQYLICKDDTDVQGNVIKVCAHRFGACVGDGEICAPCRFKSECKSGLDCWLNDQTAERFCTRDCVPGGDAVCASPHPASCDNTDPNSSRGRCTGDKDHNFPGFDTCWP